MTPSPAWHPPQLAPGRTVASITPRQADVLNGLCEGLSTHQIARYLGVEESSVRKLTSRLVATLGARDRCNAVAIAASGQVIVHVRGES